MLRLKMLNFIMILSFVFVRLIVRVQPVEANNRLEDGEEILLNRRREAILSIIRLLLGKKRMSRMMRNMFEK